MDRRLLKIIIAISSVYTTQCARSSVEVCETNAVFNICKKNDTITHVTTDIGDISKRHFILKTDGNITIGSNAFRNLVIASIDISLSTDSIYKRLPCYSLSLQSDSFAGLSDLASLAINHANVSFADGTLAPLRHLVNLKIARCGLTDVPTDPLRPLPNLLKLSLEDNDIRIIRSNAFISMKRLRRLDLSRNGISLLEMGWSEGLAQLEMLDLSLNLIKAELASFSRLNSLETLDLTDAFDGDGFRSRILNDVPTLTELRLGFNKLTAVPTDIVDLVPDLGVLHLDSNYISNVPDVFRKMKSLRYLDLAQNQIETIEPGGFAGLKMLTLDLSLNDLREIDSGTFDGLTVDALILQKNQIESLRPRAFNGIIGDTIDLSHNSLEQLDNGSFYGLTVGTLDLSMNRIERIDAGVFNNTRVEKILLMMNPVEIEGRTTWGLSDSVEIEV